MVEIIDLERDITTCCITAESFPDGVQAAHEKLHAMVERVPDRNYFGISYPIGPEKIVYHAAAEVLERDDAVSDSDCDVFFIKKGTYRSVLIRNFREDIPSIGHAFQQLLDDPRIDPYGYCLEWYVGASDVRCMVRLAD